MDTPRRGVETLDPAAEARRAEQGPRRRGRRRDRAIGIAIGILLGIAIVVIFVFYGSEDTIDAPAIDDDRPAERRGEPAR